MSDCFSIRMVQNSDVVLHRDPTPRLVRLGSQRDVRRIAISSDGRWVATGSWTDYRAGVFVWDAVTGRRVATLPAEDAGDVRFSPDGRWLATGGGGCQLWRVGSWERSLRLPDGWGMTFSPDGSLLAVNNDDVIRLVEPETGHELARLEDPNQDRAHSPTFSPDGTRLIVATSERRVLHVWDLRRIRAGLADLGLDWDLPAYPPPRRHEPIDSVFVHNPEAELAALEQQRCWAEAIARLDLLIDAVARTFGLAPAPWSRPRPAGSAR